MKYGDFSPDGREFIVENVATPRPWINYLYNREYFSTISNNGGGISYHRSPLHGRISRYRINDVLWDRPGKYLYLKDLDDNRYWSLTWQPVGRYREGYRVRHGFGYTNAEARVHGIHSSVKFFVPEEQNLEVWHLILKNRSRRRRRLSLYGYIELCLGHALIDLINQCDDQHFNRVIFDKKQNALFASKTYWVTESRGTQHQENKSWDQWAFFSSSEPILSFETRRVHFIGPYRNETNPQVLEGVPLSNEESDYGNAVAAIGHDLVLEPGEKREILFNLGVIPKKDDAVLPTLTGTCLQPEEARREGRKTEHKWHHFFSHLTADTSDPTINTFFNLWVPYQARVACDVGRVASFYYWGIGRGFGFRDTAQDTLAVTIADPASARERILLLARQMFTSGRVYHHFFKDGQGESTGHCDDPGWFILVLTDYLQETGDTGLLDAIEPYVDGKSGTIYERLLAVVSFMENNLGGHHLPLFGRGDWNDTLDYIGGEEGGESVWGGMFYVAMLKRLTDLFSHLQQENHVKRIKNLIETMENSINRHCWDGGWFIRAFSGSGKRIGSTLNTAGRIFLNPQTWAVIADISNRKRLLQALDNAHKYLNTSFGPKICAPAFNSIDPQIGLITRCVAGKKENAAIFLHPSAWMIQAECLLGRGGRAFSLLKKLLPNTIDSDTYQAEPYVFSQYITSDEHPGQGLASHSWQTGTAAWMFRVFFDYMLGVRAGYGGLYIDPVIPSEWDSFRVERNFRGCRYTIQVNNPDGVERGVRSISVNGQKSSGNTIPPLAEKGAIIQVTMG